MKSLLTLIAGLVVTTGALAQQPVAVWQALGFQQILAATVNTGASLTVPAGARMAQICADTQAVRWRDDGSAPTAAIGIILASGNCMIYSGPLNKIQFISQAAGANLNVSYYR
jgi:hypothetical protein